MESAARDSRLLTIAGFATARTSVIDPRGVLKEFGLELPDDVEVRVWDCTGDPLFRVAGSG
jgi:hypothetical protein